jgi:glucose-1-phosphate thymidylyltransferase
MIASIEEIAFRQGWIDREQLGKLGRELAKSAYGAYLVQLAEEAAP